MCSMQSQKQLKSDQATLDRARAWAIANPERRKAIALKSYLKLRSELKPVLTPFQRFEGLYTPVPATGCWLWTGSVNRGGYGKTKVDRKHITAHRWSWILHKGDIPDGLHVLHRCDVPACVNPDHLFIGTNQDNVDDRQRKDRQGKFVPIPKRVLTDEQVKEIRMLKGTMKIVDIAKKFNIDHPRVSRIHNNKIYAHVI